LFPVRCGHLSGALAQKEEACYSLSFR